MGAIGFSQIPALKFYSVGMRFLGGTGGVSYQAYAYAKGGTEGSTTFVLTQYQDGRMTVDKSLVSGGSAASGAGGSSSGSVPVMGSTSSAQSAGVGETGGDMGGDPLGSTSASSSSSSGGATRTVTQMNHSVGMGLK